LLTIALLNIAGIPPLAGFFAKYTIIKHLILQQNFYMPLVIVAASVISVFYYLKIIKNMYISTAQQIADETKTVHIPLLYKLLIAFLCAFTMLYFAVEFTPFVQSLIKA
jgi:NADH:ubiquinone oxidoreductase subunit 2 (subunit N)